MKCENCEIEHNGEYGSGRFCSIKCAKSFSTKGGREKINKKVSKKMTGKKLSEETKNKISKNNGKYWLNKKRNHSEETKKLISEKAKQRSGVINIEKSCKNCGGTGGVTIHGSVCEYCKIKYYKYFRPLCEFDFNFDDYKEFFNMELVKEYGWYSPKNKKNNLNGVSRDHLYSVSDGFKNKIDPEIIKHPANCNLVLHKHNQNKKNKSTITIEDLVERIRNWDKN